MLLNDYLKTHKQIEPSARNFFLRKEGRVDLLGETPNGLSASAACRKSNNLSIRNVGRRPTLLRVPISGDYSEFFTRSDSVPFALYIATTK